MLCKNVYSKNELTEVAVKNLSTEIDDTATISLDFNNAHYTSTKSTFANVFLEPKLFDETDSETMITFKVDDTDLSICAYDLQWWSHTKHRINKVNNIMNNNEETKSSKPVKQEVIAPTYSIGVATMIDGELSELHSFEGSKKDAINFINEETSMRYIDSFLKAKIVINLCFDKAEFEKTDWTDYKKNTELWFTLDELADMGAITLR